MNVLAAMVTNCRIVLRAQTLRIGGVAANGYSRRVSLFQNWSSRREEAHSLNPKSAICNQDRASSRRLLQSFEMGRPHGSSTAQVVMQLAARDLNALIAGRLAADQNAKRPEAAHVHAVDAQALQSAEAVQPVIAEDAVARVVGRAGAANDQVGNDDVDRDSTLEPSSDFGQAAWRQG
ncbi:MAG: hypothetical protein HZA90_11425 [Verrucomicrobia bacterium]|nr:hypothetical protein [Verrucomicrobiota bacterium]